MIRRSHRKSRVGCVEWSPPAPNPPLTELASKRRHVKCDERRPVCSLCHLSDRNCTYLTPPRAASLSVPGTPPSDLSASPSESHGQHGATVANNTPASPPPANALLPEHPTARNEREPTVDDPVNVNHMELLIHLTHDAEIFNLAGRVGSHSHDHGLYIGLKISLEAPYLLHQILAISARRLAYLRPERSDFYMHQAVSLQTRAVSLFNADWSGVNQSNCVAVLLFSSVLGHHVLADTLAFRGPGGLEPFLTHYMQCAGMHRGLYSIALAVWPLLMETELEPILSMSAGFTSREPKGTHCQRAREMVDASVGLSETEKEACRSGIRYLQVGFDAIFAENEDPAHRYQMISSWGVVAPPEITDLVAAKRPEALVLLAYYALLLHHGREMWQVRDAGAYVFGLIRDYLGPGWDPWLEYPRQGIFGEQCS